MAANMAVIKLKTSKKKEKVKERYLRLLNEHTKNYLQLLQISEKPTMRVKRLRILD